MAAYWEIATHAANYMFYKFLYLTVNLFFPPRFLEEWEFHFLIAPYTFLENLMCCEMYTPYEARQGRSPSKNGKFTIKIKVIAFIINFRRNKSICNKKM